MGKTLIFDEDYDGPRFVYGCRNRPPGYAQVPEGRIIGADRHHPDHRHGTIEYPFALSDQQKDGFELTFVRKVPGYGLHILVPPQEQPA